MLHAAPDWRWTPFAHPRYNPATGWLGIADPGNDGPAPNSGDGESDGSGW